MADFRLAFLSVQEIGDEALKKHFFIMDETRKAETILLATDEKKRQKIAADLLCRQMIADECSISEEEIIFSRAEKGKPFAVNADIYFSISHSKNTVVCAVSDKEIGVDIEEIRSIRLKAAEKFACESELEYIGNDINRFFEIWTLKEAFFKCRGSGLGADIKNVSFEITDGKITCSEKGYNLSFENTADGYICAVCTKN